MSNLRELTYPTIGERIPEVRESEGLSQRETARRAGISRSALSSIETGRNVPTVESLERISVALDLPLTQLWVGELLDETEVRGGIEFAEAGAGARPRRIWSGEGMLRCTHDFTDPRDGNVFYRERTLVSPDHRAAIAFPEYFTPAYSRDRSANILHWVEMRRQGRLGRHGEPRRKKKVETLLTPQVREPRRSALKPFDERVN